MIEKSYSFGLINHISKAFIWSVRPHLTKYLRTYLKKTKNLYSSAHLQPKRKPLGGIIMFGFGRKSRLPESPEPETPVARLEKLVQEKPNSPIAQHCREAGITPRQFYDDVQLTYRTSLWRNKLTQMQLTRELTGIPLTDYLVGQVQEKYWIYALRHEHENILALREASGVPLNDSTIATYLRNCVEKNLLPKEEVEKLRQDLKGTVA